MTDDVEILSGIALPVKVATKLSKITKQMTIETTTTEYFILVSKRFLHKLYFN